MNKLQMPEHEQVARPGVPRTEHMRAVLAESGHSPQEIERIIQSMRSHDQEPFVD